MEWLDPLVLARLQFAFTVAFHILFPAFTIGLASYLAVLEGLWLLDPRRRSIATSTSSGCKIFAVSFGMGVVSGVVMTYQFGTNWSRFSRRRRAVIGPLLAYEVLTAFFLEAGFLGIMLFGWKRVGAKAALLRHLHGRARHADLGLLDPLGQQLDAHAGRLHASSTAASCRSTGGR